MALIGKSKMLCQLARPSPMLRACTSFSLKHFNSASAEIPAVDATQFPLHYFIKQQPMPITHGIF